MFGHRRLVNLFFGIAVAVMFLLLYVTTLRQTSRIVVTTDQRLLVFTSIAYGHRHDLLRELPRTTGIGPITGNWWRSFSTLGEPLYLVPGWKNEERVIECEMSSKEL